MKTNLPNFGNLFTGLSDCSNANSRMRSGNLLKANIKALLMLLLGVLMGPLAVIAANGPSANLDQIRNGSGTSITTPVYAWVNGNANATQAHYLEGHSIAYRMVVENLSPGAHNLIIEWDTKKDTKAAIDFLTSYDNIEPHMPPFNHAAEVFDPTLGYPASYAADSNRFRIPTPTFTLNSPTALPAGASSYPLDAFNAFWNSNPTLNKSFMTMYNAGAGSGITALTYTHMVGKDQLKIDFTTANATVIFAWGGHIASKANWGTGNSAVFIPGSPYHTRLVSIDGTGGNQDRSLQSAAVTSLDPPACGVNGDVIVCRGGIGAYSATSDGTESGYSWSIVNIVKPIGGVDPTIITNPSSGPTVNAITVDPGDATSFRVRVVISKTGADPTDCGMDVQVEDVTAEVVSDGDLTCDDGTVRVSASLMGSLTLETPTYEWSLDGNPIPDSNVPFLDVTVAGTYSVTIRSNSTADGCDATDEVIVEDHTAKPEITITPRGTITCDPTTSTTLVASLSNIPGYIDPTMISYSWTKVGDATVLGTTDTYMATEAGTYRVTVEFDETGCSEFADQIVTDDKVQPNVNTAGPFEIGCNESSVTLNGTSILNGDPSLFQFLWTIVTGDGSFDLGSNPDATFTLASGTSATLKLRITNPLNGCFAEVTAQVTKEVCGLRHCTLTQGAYGNGNGKFCGGDRRSVMMGNLLANPMVIGMMGAGNRYLRFVQADVSCIIDKMPAGGTAGILPATAMYQTCGAIPMSAGKGKAGNTDLLSNGRFNNVLIGQTIALSFNVRLDNTLGSVELSPSMTTYKAMSCTSDEIDPNDLTGITRTIPQSVLTYLGANHTVADLLALANMALGSSSYVPGTGNPVKPSYANINAAVSAINEVFDECRILPNGTNNQVPVRIAGVSPAGSGTVLKAYPNPFSDVSTIEFSVAENVNYALNVYDVTGRVVATLGAGNAEAGKVYTFKVGEQRLPEGMYMVKLNVGNKVETIKIILKR